MMKRMRLLISAMLVAAPTFAAEIPADTKAAINAVFARLDSCAVKNDSTCLGELFADDATLVGPLSPTLTRGRTEVVKSLMHALSTKGAEPRQKHVVERVRLIGQDRALVDASVELLNVRVPADMAPDQPRRTWHVTALVGSKGGKWLLQDVRFFYVNEPERTPTVVPPSPPPQPTAPTPPGEPTIPAPPAQPEVPAAPAAPPKA